MKLAETPDDKSDEAQLEVLIERIATEVVRRGMETPAILFLEMHKPLSFVASQGLLVGSPVIAPLVGVKNVEVASRLMANRDNVERLIRRIEDLAADRK